MIGSHVFVNVIVLYNKQKEQKMSIVLAYLLATSALVAADKPNIVFVLVDDWGYADVSFRNPAISSPNFKDMVDNGLLLNRHYVYRYCSPSRASFLTGRWPHHVHQSNLPPGTLMGLNINMTTIASKLKTAGYSTHLIGKWHEGLFEPAHLPINRGFDTSSGFLNWGEDHMTQKIECAIDFWKNNDVDPRNGSYDAYRYYDDLTEIFTNHKAEDPFFLYLPLHNVHGPFQAPDEWLALYPENSTCHQRRLYQAMVSVADNVTGHMVELLKKKGMWDNTIVVVSADNGGAPCGGSNYPLKGCKGTYFEGGVRALAFACGGLIPEKMRGKSTNGFIHIADWYPTFCKLAGVDPDDSGTGKFPVDGLDVWPIITGESTVSPHDAIMLGYNFSDIGAIIMGNHKLIIGKQSNHCDDLMWSPLNYPCSNGTVGEDCYPYCLYDIVNDPTEKKNIADEQPDMVKKLLDRYNVYSKEPRHLQDQGYHNESSLPVDKTACQYMKDNGGYWRPWKNT